MVAKKTDKQSMDGRSQKKRPSAAGKKVAQGSRITTTASSKTGTPRLDRNALKQKKSALDSSGFKEKSIFDKSAMNDSGSLLEAPVQNGFINRESAVEEESFKETIHKGKSFNKAGKPSKRKGISRRFLVGSLIVIALLVIGTGLLAWNQWFRYDDKADIQGTWVIEGSSQTITFTDADIVMTSEVSYPYTLDTFQKTISFSFKQYNGSGSYSFSPERTTLVITETDADSGEKVSTKLVKQ